jgi:hypothetical protein
MLDMRHPLFLASLLLSACSIPFGSSTATPTFESTSAPQFGPASLDLDDPLSLGQHAGDYTIGMSLVFEGVGADGSPVSGRLDAEGANRLTPLGSRLNFATSGAAGVGGATVYEVVTIGQDTYFNTDVAGCAQMPATEFTIPFAYLVNTGGILGGIAPRVQPDVEINGVPAFQFALMMDNIDLPDEISIEVHSVSHGALYVAQAGGYVLRVELEARGASELLSGDESLEGDIGYQLDFIPVPSVGSILPPQGCEPAEASESEFPIYPGAANIASFEGFTTYQSSTDLNTLTDFFKVEMAARGWTLTDEESLVSVATLNFSMGDRAVSIVIAFDPNANLATVVIGEE